MDLKELKEEIKKIALDSGAKLVGVGSRERLEGNPPSANMDYSLPGAQSCIIWAYPNDIEALENYFSKKERMSMKVLQDQGYATGWKTAEKIAKFIEENTEYKAHPIIPNGEYRGGTASAMKNDEAFPPFSLRYGAVAAGLGHLGWSGNLVSKQYGGSLYLDGVLTTATLKPDPMAKENNCDLCKICQKVCTTGYVAKDESEERQPVVIGGVKQTYGKRGTYMKCGIGCAGFTGLSVDGTWSTWTANHTCLKNIPDKELTRGYARRSMQELMSGKNTPRQLRKFNQRIAASFAKVGITENVGLRPIEDTNPRCGNCNFICVADHKKRVELYKMLKTSGILYLDEIGREYIKKIDENGKEVIYYPPTWEEYLEEKET